MPCPKPRWRLGLRRMSKTSGSANAASSWLAEAICTMSAWPAGIGVVPITTSEVVVRRLREGPEWLARLGRHAEQLHDDHGRERKHQIGDEIHPPGAGDGIEQAVDDG